MSLIEDPESNVTLQVTIPENSEAGDNIIIHCPDNSYVQFITPENVVSGDTVHVKVGDSTENAILNTDSGKASTVDSTNSYRGVAAVTTVSGAFSVIPNDHPVTKTLSL